MSAIELLGQSIEKGHGREFTAEQLAEIGETFQAMQYELMSQQLKTESITRIAIVAVDGHGGSLNMTADVYDDTLGYKLDVNWDEEGDIIHVETNEVEMPEVQLQDEADVGEGDGNLPPVPSEGGAEGEVASGENGTG